MIWLWRSCRSYNIHTSTLKHCNQEPPQSGVPCWNCAFRAVTSSLDTIIFGGSTFYRHLRHGDHEIPYNTCAPPRQHISISLLPSQVVQEICESTSVNCHRSTIFSQAPLQTLSNRAAQGNGFGQISTRTELRYQGHRADGIEEVQHGQQVGMHPQLLAVAGLVEVRLLKTRLTIMMDECPKLSTSLCIESVAKIKQQKAIATSDSKSNFISSVSTGKPNFWVENKWQNLVRQ